MLQPSGCRAGERSAGPEGTGSPSEKSAVTWRHRFFRRGVPPPHDRVPPICTRQSRARLPQATGLLSASQSGRGGAGRGGAGRGGTNPARARHGLACCPEPGQGLGQPQRRRRRGRRRRLLLWPATTGATCRRLQARPAHPAFRPRRSPTAPAPRRRARRVGQTGGTVLVGGGAGGGGRGLGAGRQVDLGDEQSAGGVRLAVVSPRVVIEFEDALAVGPGPGPGVGEACHFASVNIMREAVVLPVPAPERELLSSSSSSSSSSYLLMIFLWQRTWQRAGIHPGGCPCCRWRRRQES